MGYCYDMMGRLCCDVCGSSGGVRKYRCPWNWCSATALCPSCKEKHPEYNTKDFHRQQGCERNHLRFQADEQKKRDLLNDGKFVRCSARQTEDGKRVQVIFYGLDREGKQIYQGFLMSCKAYESIPIGDVATTEDFAWACAANNERIERCSSEYENGSHSKEAAIR